MGTFHQLLDESGFKFTARKTHYEHQCERPEIIRMCQNFVGWIKQYRDEDYVGYYQDETRVFKNMAQGKVWSFDGEEPPHKVSLGSGDCAIVRYLGSGETGLLKNSLVFYHGAK